MPILESDDQDFIDGMNSVVAVQVDTNASGADTTPHGGTTRIWQPVAGQQAERCRIVMQKGQDPEWDSRPGATIKGRVLFWRGIYLDLNYRLVYVDPGTGLTRSLYPQGACVDEHQLHHHWFVEVLEYVA